jgi:glycerate dehydrogenase
MKIVVLDGYTLNPGDLGWRSLEELGDCTFYDRTAPNELLHRAKDADALVTNKVALSADILARLPTLRYIGVTATGYNIVDVEAARRQGVTVTNVPAYSTRSVAQMVFAHLLNLTLRIEHHAQTVDAGRWTASADFAYWDFPLIDVAGRTLGIVGYGQIGQAVARIGRALDMRVLASDRSPQNKPAEGIEFCDLDRLFRQSDVLSLHCPLTPQTERLVDRTRLAWMKPTAFLINTSRGGLIDEAALADALNAGQLAGAGLDVLSREPPPADNPLLSAKNCRITPHYAWATTAARRRLMDVAVANLRAFMAGQPQNVV